MLQNIASIISVTAFTAVASLFTACSSDSASSSAIQPDPNSEISGGDVAGDTILAILPQDTSTGITPVDTTTVDASDTMVVVPVTPTDTVVSVISADPVAALPAAGFYEPFNLGVVTPQNGGIVRCTFDGSEPTDSTSAMTAARNIATTTVARCYEFVQNSVVSKQTETYFINETVQLPVVSVSVDPVFYTDYWTSEPCKPDPCYEAKFWEDVEYPTHVEYFEGGSASKAKAFEIDAGIKIFGGWSRNFDKRSVAITMRKEYEDGRLNYPLFDTRKEHSEFKSFVLRNNGQRFVSDYVGDPLFSTMLEGTGIDYQRSRQVVVFANGIYRGIYDMREKLNEHYIENNYGIDSKSVDMVKIVDGEITTNSGSGDDYEKLIHYAFTNDMSGENNAAYAEIQTMMDLPEYVDYMAAQIYYANSDWPNNNVRAWHSAEQPWKFIAYDLDFSFDWTWTAAGFGDRKNMFEWILTGGGETHCKGNSSDEKCFHSIFVSLWKNPDFKRMLANHAAVLYTSYLNNDRFTSVIDSMLKNLPATELTRDQKLYPRAQYWYRNSCGNGFETDGACLKEFAASRDESVRQEFYDEYGFTGDMKVTIASQGSGYVTVDEMKLPSTNYTGNFFAGASMMLEAVANGGTFSEWSDGSTENPRLVTPADGDTFTAVFK